MTTRLFLVRHGESTWNAVRRWQGQADPPLSDRGEEQARSAAVPLTALGEFDVVVTSTLDRARRTGELLAEGAAVSLGEALPELVERAAGAWEGMTRVSIEERYPGYLADHRRPDGYENDAAVADRAVPAIGSLAARHDGRRLVVVSHGGVINALERHALGDVEEQWRRIENLEGRWFEHDNAGLRVVGDRIGLLAADDAGVEPQRPVEPYA